MGSNFWRLLKITADFKWWMLLAAFLGFLTIGSGIGLLMTSAYIIAKAALHPSIAELQISIVGVRFFGITRGLFRYLERYVSHQVTFRLLQRFRIWFYKSIEPLAPARLTQYKSGDLLARIVSDIETLEHFYLRMIAPPVIAIMIVILMWFLIGTYNVKLSLIIISFLTSAGIGIPALTSFLSKKIGRDMIEIRAQLHVGIVDCIQGMPDLMVFGQWQKYEHRMQQLDKNFLILRHRASLVSALHQSLTGLIMNITIFTTLTIAIPLASTFELNGVYLTVIILGIMAAFECILPLPQAAEELEKTLKAADRLFEIVDMQPNIQEPQAPLKPIEKYSIKFRDVSFSYESGQSTLQNITFSLSQGNSMAVVGPSGAGKSSLLNLLFRFWEFPEGDIFLGNNSIRDYKQHDISNMIALVPQRIYLFNGTIRDNLLLAKPKATEPELIDAVKQAQFYDFILKLSQGFDSWIGEQGVRLSGGERQRLAIARALLKGTPILLLDEPTVHLDAETESRILKTIWRLKKEKTIMLITHRLVGLTQVDHIIVMSQGKIVEQGKHRELLLKKDYYYHMWQSQSELFEL